MKKEEILKKAQEEGSDEMEKFVQDKSIWWGAVAMCFCLIAFTIIRRRIDQYTFDLTATIAAGVAAQNFYQYKKLHIKRNLLAGIFMAVGAVLCAIWFVQEALL